MRQLILLALAIGWTHCVSAHTPGATYLANEGVLITTRNSKIVFDPLFDDDYGRFENLPTPMREKLILGEAPYNDLDAAFISHSHGDHFSPYDLTRLMINHQNMTLFAPQQAIDNLVAYDGFKTSLLKRVNVVPAVNPLVAFSLEKMQVEAFSIPHNGWPNRMTDIHNVAYRVVVDGVSVIHLGDSDTTADHFEVQGQTWKSHESTVTFPPYWFLFSEPGKAILAEQLRPGQIIGIHVPRNFPDAPEDRPEEYRGPDLFTVPGESRTLEKPKAMPSRVSNETDQTTNAHHQTASRDATYPL